jgi:tRNA U54 and U55 pseudouridine synthase Pus10
MEIMELSEEDMQSSSGGGNKWFHEDIQEFIKNAYSKLSEEDGQTVVVGVKLSEVADEWYDGTLQELKDLDYTKPNVNRAIRKNLKPAGFDNKSKQEKRKWAVSTSTQKDGEVVFKIELNPLQD